MNRTDRLLAILLELQARKMTRAEDLAALFETSVRTIYRDIQAICEAGVPIVAIPGQGYSLMEGYFLPPVTLSADEAIAMMLGSDYVHMQFDAKYARHAETAQQKIQAIMPEPLWLELQQLRSYYRFIAPQQADAVSGEDEPAWKSTLALLRHAMVSGVCVELAYEKAAAAWHAQAAEWRTVEPYGLVLQAGVWLLTAYCRLRQEIRHFRLDRMKELRLTDEPYARPEGFDIQQYRPADRRETMVELRFEPHLARRLKENRSFYMHEERITEEALYQTLRVNRIEDVLPWIMSWGSAVQVIAPSSLQERIAEEAQKIIQHYQNRTSHS